MRLRPDPWIRYAFGIHKWRWLTFPAAILAFLYISLHSPVLIVQALAYGLLLFYVFSFALVLTGRLRLPWK